MISTNGLSGSFIGILTSPFMDFTDATVNTVHIFCNESCPASIS